MQCRYCKALWDAEWEYCPDCHRNAGGAIYPEKVSALEAAEVGRLTKLISDAFQDVCLEDGTTLHEAHLEGVYSDDSVRVVARAKDPETNWRDVPDWKIERFASLCFHDIKGWRFYVPAYMIWTLRHWRTTDSCTGDFTILNFIPNGASHYYRARYATLSLAQASAVYEFVKFFCDFSNDIEPHTAIHEYWHNFAPEVTRTNEP